MKNVDLVLRFLEAPGQRVADRQHADDLSVVDNGNMANVMPAHQLSRGLHRVLQTAPHYLCRQNVARTQMLQFAPHGFREGTHEAAFGDDADHAHARIADGIAPMLFAYRSFPTSSRLWSGKQIKDAGVGA